MVNYPGSFSGRLVRRPEVEWATVQTVRVSAEQNGHNLTTEIITNIGVNGREFNLNFNYESLINPVHLVIATLVDDEQFNQDNPVVLEDLVLDALFTIPHFLHSGSLISNDVVVDTGNVLWCSGKLIYTFNLPIIRLVLQG